MHFGVFRTQGNCLVVAKCQQRSPNPLAKFEGPLKGTKKRGAEIGGMGKGKGVKKRKKTSPKQISSHGRGDWQVIRYFSSQCRRRHRKFTGVTHVLLNALRGDRQPTSTTTKILSQRTCQYD